MRREDIEFAGMSTVVAGLVILGSLAAWLIGISVFVPLAADGPYRQRESASCVCREAK